MTNSSLEQIDKLLKTFDDHEFPGHDDVPYVDGDFREIRQEIRTKFDQLTNVVASLDHHELNSESKDSLSRLVTFLAQNQTLQLWNDSQIVEQAQDLLAEIRNRYQLYDVTFDRSETIMYRVLRSLNAKLNKENWLLNPMGMQAFLWCLEVLKTPNLSEYLDLVFTPPLLFLDHYLVANRRDGLRCLNVIVESPAELRMYGRADVYYVTVVNLLYVRETRLIPLAFKSARQLAKIVQKTDLEQWTKTDDVLQLLLGNMELDSDPDRKCIYLELLEDFINEIGIGMIAHSKILMRIFQSYLEISSGQIALRTLTCLNRFMETCWVRISGHCEEIARILLRFLIDRKDDPDECEMCKKCLLFLANIHPEIDAELLIENVDNILQDH